MLMLRLKKKGQKEHHTNNYHNKKYTSFNVSEVCVEEVSYSFPWIAPPYTWSVPYNAES